METYGTQGKFHASILLAIIAWVILLVVILPRQRTALGALGMLPESEASPEEDKIASWSQVKKQLSMYAGIFNLIWIVVLVLMFV